MQAALPESRGFMDFNYTHEVGFYQETAACLDVFRSFQLDQFYFRHWPCSDVAAVVATRQLARAGQFHMQVYLRHRP
jgi:hypothetical protein